MARIIDNRAGIDQTIRIFDDFYSFNAVVNPDEYDVVHSYFVEVCDTVNIADNFTVTLFRVSQQTGIPVMTLLNNVRGTETNQLQMNKTICYFLNSLKSNTGLYGISQLPKPNQPVSRNILQ